MVKDQAPSFFSGRLCVYKKELNNLLHLYANGRNACFDGVHVHHLLITSFSGQESNVQYLHRSSFSVCILHTTWLYIHTILVPELPAEQKIFSPDLNTISTCAAYTCAVLHGSYTDSNLRTHLGHAYQYHIFSYFALLYFPSISSIYNFYILELS